MPGTKCAGMNAACSTSAKIVVRVAVEHQPADLDQRVVRVRPHLGEVERVEAVVAASAAGMICTLSVQDGMLAALDGLQQVALVVTAGPRRRAAAASLGGQAPDALVGLEVVLDPEALAGALIHWKVCEPKPSMWRYEAGMPRSPNSQVNWCVASGEREKKSQTLSGSCRSVYGSRFCEWMKSGNLMRVADEEHRRVVADEVVVALLGVELQREAARVADRVRRAQRAGDGREAQEHLGPLADLGEELRARPARDVVGHLEVAVGAGADARARRAPGCARG